MPTLDSATPDNFEGPGEVKTKGSDSTNDEGVRSEELPILLAPMLASAGELPDFDQEWAYEFKWDGVRALVATEHGAVRAWSRNGNDLGSSFPEFDELASDRAVLLDGEVVCFNEQGRPNFGLLQRRLHVVGATARNRARELPATLLVFDVLHLGGLSLRECPYLERRAVLSELAFGGESIVVPPSFTDRDGSDVLAAATEAGLEGVMAKRRSSPYLAGARSSDWLKIKNFRTQEVVIGGFTRGNGERRNTFGALLLGIPDANGLGYVGKVGTGFDEASRRSLLQQLRAITSDVSPFSTGLGREGSETTFVKPIVVGEVRFGEWTSEGRLRHPVWRGIRSDKSASEVVREP